MSRAVSMRAASARRGRRAGASEDPSGEVELARRVVAVMGGRYSAGLGIDVDAGAGMSVVAGHGERWPWPRSAARTRVPGQSARAAARVTGRAAGLIVAASAYAKGGDR
jgi:hypothetical protein